MVGKSIEKVNNHMDGLQEKYYVQDKIRDFASKRKNTKTLLQALETFKSHQEFLASVYENTYT